MVTAGIDVGLENIKVIVMKDGEIAGKACGLSGGAGRPAAVRAVYAKALENAGINTTDVEKVVSTGKGKFDVDFANAQLSETLVAAQAAKMFEPMATTVVDVGADEIIVITPDNGKISEFVINQKCSAGLGLLLERMADRFEMSMDELSALEGPGTVTVNEGCAVFAELDALSLVNRGIDVEEVLKALIEACAWRASTTLNDIYKSDTSCAVMLGGMSKNKAFVRALERISGIEFIIPDEAFYAGAIGAAALASVD